MSADNIHFLPLSMCKIQSVLKTKLSWPDVIVYSVSRTLRNFLGILWEYPKSTRDRLSVYRLQWWQCSVRNPSELSRVSLRRLYGKFAPQISDLEDWPQVPQRQDLRPREERSQHARLEDQDIPDRAPTLVRLVAPRISKRFIKLNNFEGTKLTFSFLENNSNRTN